MGDQTMFLDLCNIMETISKTKKRLEIQDIICKFFEEMLMKDPGSLVASLFLLTGTIYPEYYNKELGIGDSLLKNIVCNATGLRPKTLQEKYVQFGDLGMIAMERRVNQLFVTQRRIAIVEILEILRSLTEISGKNANSVKTNMILSVINELSALETKYFIRLLEMKLKIGLALQTVLISLGLAFRSVGFDENDEVKEKKRKGKKIKVTDLKVIEPVKLYESNQKVRKAYDLLDYFKTGIEENEIESRIEKNERENRIEENKRENDLIIPVKPFKRVENSLPVEKLIEHIKDSFNKQPDFENLVRLIFKHGINKIAEKCKIFPGVPLKPMLAQPAHNLTKVFARIGERPFISEFKYDGERVQIHHSSVQTWIFSRNCENISMKYSDLAILPIHDCSFVLDGEVVAFANGQILPFQVLSNRKRKHSEKIEVNVCVFAFDLLFFDDKELLSMDLGTRRKILRDNFREIDNKFLFARGTEETGEDAVGTFFKESTESRCEGIMVKVLDSAYKPSARTNSWIKIKSDYMDNMGDSIDLVVIGGYYGKGKRKGVYGGYLLAAYNDENDKYEACCKIGTGFSDDDLEKFHKQFSEYITVNTNEFSYKSAVNPDVWFEPRFVWEIKAASFSLSPIYSVGTIANKGLSLRFPRFIREREDKAPKDSTTSNQMLNMYNEEVNDSEDYE